MSSKPPEEPVRSGDGGLARARTGRALAVGVALLEAGALAVAGAVAVLRGLGDGSLVLGLGVGAVAAGVAYLLVEVARGFGRWRAWPTGIFLTVQLLVVLVALSVGSRAVLSLLDNPRVGGLTLAAVLVGLTGLVGAGMMAGHTRRGAGPPVL